MLHYQLLGLLLLFNISLISSEYYAISVLERADGEEAMGTISFWATNTSITRVTVHITNITTNPNGIHGLNIFTYGDFRGFNQNPLGTAGSNVEGVEAFGGEFTTDDEPHGCPELGTGNAGNLGNWQANNGVIWASKDVSNIKLSGDDSVIGRTIALYDIPFNCSGPTSDANLIAYGPVGIGNMNGNQAAAVTGNEKGVCVFVGTASCSQHCDLGSAGFAVVMSNNSRIHLTAQIRGINSPRGIHIHTYGDLNSTDGTTAGGHYNPDAQMHGLPGLNPGRHLGDFGSIQDFDNNFGYYDYAPEYTPASSVNLDRLIGRAIIIHSGVDHGNEPTCPDAANTGASGKRDYVCVIGIANDQTPNNTNDQLPEPDLPANFEQNSTWTTIPCSSSTPQPAADEPAEDVPSNPPDVPEPENSPDDDPSGAQSLFQAVTVTLTVIVLSQIINF